MRERQTVPQPHGFPTTRYHAELCQCCCAGCDCGCAHVCPLTRDGRDEAIEDLIEQSSLGTPGAKALRERTPPEVVDRIMRKAGYEPPPSGSEAL